MWSAEGCFFSTFEEKSHSKNRHLVQLEVGPYVCAESKPIIKFSILSAQNSV